MRRENRWRSFWLLISAVGSIIGWHATAHAMAKNPFSGATSITVSMKKQHHHWPTHHRHGERRD
jgi:hypothetical protein